MRRLVFLLVLSMIGLCTLAQSEDERAAIEELIAKAGKSRYNDPMMALENAREALRSSIDSGHKDLVGNSYKAIGGIWYIRGDYDKALSNFLDALDLFQSLKDTTNISQLLSNLGLVYKNIGDMDLSLDHYNQALKLQAANPDTLTVSRLLNNIGVIYKNRGDYDEAANYFSRSLAYKEAIDDRKGVANTLTNLGIINSKKGSDRIALQYFFRSQVVERELGLEEGMAKNYNNIALSYLQLGNCDSAQYYADLGLRIGEKLGTKIQIMEASQILSQCMAQNGRYRLAYRHQGTHMAMKDSLMNEDKAREIGRLESKLELAKQEAEIDLLAKENQLAEAELSRKQVLQVSLIAVIILVIAISVYVVITQRQKNALREQALMGELTELRNEINVLVSKYEEGFDANLETINEKLVEPLSEREFEALKLTIEGKQNREIAELLFISTNTVKFHLKNIYMKLGVNNRKEALQYVVQSS